MKLFTLLVFSLISTLNAVDQDRQRKVSDYFKILKESRDSSAVPLAILNELEKIKDESLDKLITSELQKELKNRRLALIKACRNEAYKVIKKNTDKQAEAIKAKLSGLRGMGVLSEENLSQVNKQTRDLMEIFIPEQIKWGQNVTKRLKLFESLNSSLVKFNSNDDVVDFPKIEFIAKASVCPLLLNDKTSLLNLKLLSSISLNCAAAVYHINLIRFFNGKNTLLIDPKLNLLAKFHSKDMKSNGYLSHESPTEGMKTLKDRASRFKTTASEEIIGRGTSDVLQLNNAYLKRYKNAMLYYGPWTRIGVGYFEKHWTEVFGK